MTPSIPSDTPFRRAFPSQLRLWAFHGILTCLPSLAIAVIHLNLLQSLAAGVAMAAAVGIFIVVFAAATASLPVLSDPRHIAARAIQIALKFRAWISLFSLVLIAFGTKAYLILPDLWCGLAAVAALNQLSHWLPGFDVTLDHEKWGAAEIFVIALADGLVLTLLLAGVAFFTAVFLQLWDRMKPGFPTVQGR